MTESFSDQILSLRLASYPAHVLISVAEGPLKSKLLFFFKKGLYRSPVCRFEDCSCHSVHPGPISLFKGNRPMCVPCVKRNTSNHLLHVQEQNIVYNLPLKCGKLCVVGPSTLTAGIARALLQMLMVLTNPPVPRHAVTASSGEEPEVDYLTREVIKAEMIERLGDSCVSKPSSALSCKEFALRKFCKHHMYYNVCGKVVYMRGSFAPNKDCCKSVPVCVSRLSSPLSFDAL